MSTFSLTTLFVLPTGNTLPTTGDYSNLTAKQFGVFLPNYAPATAITAGSAAYLTMAQGRTIYAPGESVKASDKIYARNIVEWYKATGTASAAVQISQISALNIGCNEDVSVTLRLHSMYIDTAYHNGLTRSVMVTTPCCDCGENPCNTLTADQIATVMAELAAAINADDILNNYVLASTSGTGADTTVLIGGLPLTAYGLPCDLTAFPYQFDRMYFWTFVRSGPALTTDYEVTDACDTVATVTVLQRATMPKFTADEVTQLEKDFYSYQAEYKAIFSEPGFNGEYATYVDASVYDMYYLKFKEPTNPSWGMTEPMDEAVMFMVPQGETTALEAILVAAYGTPVNESVTEVTTTTSTTTSTTSTTSTTTLTP